MSDRPWVPCRYEVGILVPDPKAHVCSCPLAPACVPHGWAGTFVKEHSGICADHDHVSMSETPTTAAGRDLSRTLDDMFGSGDQFDPVIRAIEAEAVATLTAALEQERAKVATLVEAASPFMAPEGMPRRFVSPQELRLRTVLSDLSAASTQYVAKLCADAVAEERERLLKGSEEASDELASMCHYLRGFIEEEDQDGIDQVEFYLEKVDGRAPWRLVPLALLAPEQP